MVVGVIADASLKGLVEPRVREIRPSNLVDVLQVVGLSRGVVRLQGIESVGQDFPVVWVEAHEEFFVPFFS